MVKNYNFTHVFDCYPVYQVLYGSNPIDKHREALCGVVMAQMWLDTHYKKGWTDGVDVLEILSGLSEHEPHFRNHATFPIKSYYNNDLRAHPESKDRQIAIGDACTAEFPQVDLVLANFFAASQIMDKQMNHSRAKMLDLYKNMYKTLRPGGAFIMDYSEDGQRTAVEDLVENDDEETYDLFYGVPLREFLGLPAHAGDYQVRTKWQTFYDRVGCKAIEQIKYVKVVQILKSGMTKQVATFKFKQPFTQRYWCESELVDIAKEAGFKKFQFWHEDNDEDVTFNPLPIMQGYVDDVDDLTRLMSNKLVCIK